MTYSDVPFLTVRKRCSKCKQVKESSAFPRRARYPDGLDYWCQACYSERTRQRDARVPPNRPLAMQTHKLCTKCGQEKRLEDFGVHRRGAAGRMAECKSCHNIRMHLNRRRQREQAEIARLRPGA